MSRVNKWEREALAATEQLKAVQKAFSAAGLYVTALLLTEAVRVGEYERSREVEVYKLRKKRTKK